ncbi:Hpt domain-containing protein, partial [Burkholderia ambifaria]|uniref:Hpt domain-containing protein n=1 Tax=Burkholderia ambifaria TaxID=152480 RepID=UPI003C7996B9
FFIVKKHFSIYLVEGGLGRMGGRFGGCPPRARAPAPVAAAMTDEVRRTLHETTLHSLAAIGDALASGDADTLRIELHSMRGGFALAGDTDARDACASAERAMADGGPDDVRRIWPDVEAAIEQALDRLRLPGPNEGAATDTKT